MPTLTERLDEVAHVLRTWEAERDLSGAVLLTRAGETLFEGCYGPADRATATPVTRRTRFGLASVTKMFTAAAVADLVTAGDLAFTARVVDVLPPERRPSTLSPEVTVHHLLCHTSGIADYFEEEPEPPEEEGDYAELWRHRPSYSMTRPADFLPLFGDLPAYRDPGLRWQYSNAGYIVLGLVVEEVTGRPYTEVVEERVFARAGMTASAFLRLDEAHPDVATGYLPRASADEPWRTNVYGVPVIGGADGGAFSTLGDLDRFLTAYDDGSLLGDLRDVVLARQVEIDSGYAFGYGVMHYPDGAFGHGGGDPGVEVGACRWSATRTNLVVLTNSEGLGDEVRDLLRSALAASS